METRNIYTLMSYHLPEMPYLSIEEIKELTQSIRNHGILVPLIISGYRVVDGFERISIADKIGLKDVPVIQVGELEPDERTRLNIEINVRRRQLTAEQKRLLLATYLKTAPQQSTRTVAERLSVSQSLVCKARRQLPVEYKNSTAIIGKDRKHYRSDAKRGQPTAKPDVWLELESTLDALEKVKSIEEVKELATRLRAMINGLKRKSSLRTNNLRELSRK